MLILAKVSLILCLFLPPIITPASSLQCMNEENKPIDWYVIYKLPKQKQNKNELISKGTAYAYMTSEDYTQWKYSDKSINDTDSIVANTLKGLYENKEKYFYILYNDQPPYGESIPNKGHNKGVIMGNKEGGFWLVHSVPHFPMPQEANYMYPKTGVHYGQSFLCISMDLHNLNKIGLQLQYNEPQIYSENLVLNLLREMPNLEDAANNKTVTTAPWFHVSTVVSKNSTEFTSFAKSDKWGKDLYEDLVAPSLESDLYVETWPNEPGRLPSDCSKKFKVNNILSVLMKTANYSFKTTQDHAKWAVTPSIENTSWICIGDINRAEHQKFRGGGTVCLNNKILATGYQKSVESIQKCEPQI